MMLKVEASRSIVYFAACVIDEWLAGRYSDTQLAEAASMTKAYCSEAFFLSLAAVSNYLVAWVSLKNMTFSSSLSGLNQPRVF